MSPSLNAHFCEKQRWTKWATVSPPLLPFWHLVFSWARTNDAILTEWKSSFVPVCSFMSSSFCTCLLCVGFLMLAERVWICLFNATLQHLMTRFCICLCSVLKDGVCGYVVSCCLNKCLTLVSHCLFCKSLIQSSIQMFGGFIKEFFLKHSSFLWALHWSVVTLSSTSLIICYLPAVVHWLLISYLPC